MDYVDDEKSFSSDYPNHWSRLSLSKTNGIYLKKFFPESRCSAGIDRAMADECKKLACMGQLANLC